MLKGIAMDAIGDWSLTRVFLCMKKSKQKWSISWYQKILWTRLAKYDIILIAYLKGSFIIIYLCTLKVDHYSVDED